MKKSLFIGQVASLAREIEVTKVNLADFGLAVSKYDVADDAGSLNFASEDDDQTSKCGVLDGLNLSARKARIVELLGEFDEPEDSKHQAVSDDKLVCSARSRFIIILSPLVLCSAVVSGEC